MFKSTKHHWPPPEPPDFIPDGWLPLFEAYKLLGRAQFGKAWMDGRELAAASDEDLEAVREARSLAVSRQEEKARHLARSKRASMGVRSGPDVHSSDIRARVAGGRSIRYRTPRAVEKYIESHALYRRVHPSPKLPGECPGS